jgi:hypothetical protein
MILFENIRNSIIAALPLLREGPERLSLELALENLNRNTAAMEALIEWGRASLVFFEDQTTTLIDTARLLHAYSQLYPLSKPSVKPAGDTRNVAY